MLGFLVRRFGESILVLFAVSFASYGLIGLMPGDPVDLMFMADPNVTPEDIARLRAIHGLDRPIVERYFGWLSGAITGEFGFSRLYRLPVGDILLPRLWATLQLLGFATVLSLAIAIPTGVFAAMRPRGLVDSAINLVCFAGISVPPFWLALMLIAYIAIPVAWIPAGGMAEDGAGLLEHARYMALPVLALTLASVGGFIRFVRAAMIETLGEDYIRTARAKGAGPYRQLFVHALRNALLPLITIVALSFGTLFSGALITETIFGWAGMGRTIYEATMGNDFNLALMGLMVATGFILLANIAADLAYAMLDPRIRVDSGGTGS